MPQPELASATRRFSKRSGLMPHYFFDLHDDRNAVDPEGKDLPDLEAAIAHALIETRYMIQANIAEFGRVDLRHHIDVREGGEVVYVMRFEDAITVQRGAEVLSRPSALRSL